MTGGKNRARRRIVVDLGSKQKHGLQPLVRIEVSSSDNPDRREQKQDPCLTPEHEHHFAFATTVVPSDLK